MVFPGLDLNGEAGFCDHAEIDFAVRSMNQGKLVVAQVMQHLPLTTFRRCVVSYQGEHKVKTSSCLDQFL